MPGPRRFIDGTDGSAAVPDPVLGILVQYAASALEFVTASLLHRGRRRIVVPLRLMGLATSQALKPARPRHLDLVDSSPSFPVACEPRRPGTLQLGTGHGQLLLCARVLLVRLARRGIAQARHTIGGRGTDARLMRSQLPCATRLSWRG